MKKIIGILRPFDLEQKFYVYEDGNKIDAVKTSLDDIPTTVIGLADKYEVKQLDLSGPKQFSAGVSNKIKEEEVRQYSKERININII